MSKLLVVVDYQNDFVTGALGFKEAVDIEPNIIKLIKEFEDSGDEVIFTMDTHDEDYLNTVEGKGEFVTKEYELDDAINLNLNHLVLETGLTTLELPNFSQASSVSTTITFPAVFSRNSIIVLSSKVFPVRLAVVG